MAQVEAMNEMAVADFPRDRGLDLKGKQIVLMLQGGGALGAYQVGAFEVLARKCERIDWVAGISIGAINAAVIAAPKNGNPVDELEALWKEILSPKYPPFDYTELMKAWLPWPWQGWFRELDTKYCGWTWTAFNLLGQGHFFSSRVLNPFENPWVQQWFRKLGPHELAFYGTEALAETLNKHLALAKLDSRTRLSLGAARVCDGEVEFFDSQDSPGNLTSDHVLASAALPPAFPPIQIGDEWYFDGGVSSNTPIEALAEKLFKLEKDTLVFLIDLWDRKNKVLPESFDDILWRQKCIQYGSRKTAVEKVVERYRYRCLAEKAKGNKPVRLEVCQLMLEHKDSDPQFCFADADFSWETFDKLRRQGSEDMMNALRHAEKVPEEDTSVAPFASLHEALRHAKLVSERDSSVESYATLYRYGSQGKWKTPRAEHKHQIPKGCDEPRSRLQPFH